MFVKLKFRSCPKAIALIKETNGTQIKDKAVMEKLMEYLRRNKPYIPCYAIRKQLGLGNSSNIGEKMNDLIVSDRQKHKWNELVEARFRGPCVDNSSQKKQRGEQMV